METLKDYLGVISIFVVFISYLLGMLMHRIIQVIILFPLNVLAKKFKLDFIFLTDTTPRFYLNSFALYQYGSPYLQREIDIQFGAFALFSSMIVSLPILGFSFYRWLVNSAYYEWARSELIVFIVLWFFLLIAVVRQRRKYNDLLKVSFSELMKIHKQTIADKHQSSSKK